MKHIRGLVVKSTPKVLSVRLETGVIVNAPVRVDLGYMDAVCVAYDFTRNRVSEVLTPKELNNKSMNERPFHEDVEEERDLETERDTNNWIDEIEFRDAYKE